REPAGRSATSGALTGKRLPPTSAPVPTAASRSSLIAPARSAASIAASKCSPAPRSRHQPSDMIALDAMGGDLAPASTVEGALRAHRERGLQILLVGDETRLRSELHRLGAGEE